MALSMVRAIALMCVGWDRCDEPPSIATLAESMSSIVSTRSVAALQPVGNRSAQHALASRLHCEKDREANAAVIATCCRFAKKVVSTVHANQ